VTSTPPSIYLASPLGFTPYGALYDRELVKLVTKLGCVALDPWTSPEGTELGRLVTHGANTTLLHEANIRAGAANLAMIRSCDAILACLDGTNVDDGTASEIGFGAGIGRVVAGYRTDLRVSGDNQGTPINLQVAYFISDSGGAIFDGPEKALIHLISVLGSSRS
jgi:nucleoside 2-deoxyribosyltransferase